MKDVFGSLYSHREQRPSLADEIEREKKIAPIFGGDLLGQLRSMRRRRTVMRRVILTVALIYAAGLAAFIAMIVMRNSVDRTGPVSPQALAEKNPKSSPAPLALDNPKNLRQAVMQWRDAGEQLKEARIWIQKGRYDTATSLLQQTLSTNPNHIDVLFELAQLFNQQGAYDRARDLLPRVIALDPQRKAAIQMLAAIYSRSEQHEQALILANWLLESDADCAEAHRVAGLAYLKTNRLDLALVHFRKWVTMEPDNLVAQKQYADVILSLKEYDKAGTLYEAILKKKPDEADAYRQLAICYAKTTKVDQTVATLIQAIYVVGATKVTAWFKDPGFESVRNQKLFALLERQMVAPHPERHIADGGAAGRVEANIDLRRLEQIQAMLKPGK